MPFVLMLVLPFVPGVAAVTVNGSPFGSLSLPSTATDMGVLAIVLAVSFVASGGAFGAGFTVTVTVAVSNPPMPSEIVYANESVPVKPLFGV